MTVLVKGNNWEETLVNVTKIELVKQEDGRLDYYIEIKGGYGRLFQKNNVKHIITT